MANIIFDALVIIACISIIVYNFIQYRKNKQKNLSNFYAEDNPTTNLMQMIIPAVMLIIFTGFLLKELFIH